MNTELLLLLFLMKLYTSSLAAKAASQCPMQVMDFFCLLVSFREMYSFL